MAWREISFAVVAIIGIAYVFVELRSSGYRIVKRDDYLIIPDYHIYRRKRFEMSIEFLDRFKRGIEITSRWLRNRVDSDSHKINPKVGKWHTGRQLDYPVVKTVKIRPFMSPLRVNRPYESPKENNVPESCVMEVKV